MHVVTGTYSISIEWKSGWSVTGQEAVNSEEWKWTRSSGP
jgi:hypothetical protein